MEKMSLICTLALLLVLHLMPQETFSICWLAGQWLAMAQVFLPHLKSPEEIA